VSHQAKMKASLSSAKSALYNAATDKTSPLYVAWLAKGLQEIAAALDAEADALKENNDLLVEIKDLLKRPPGNRY
jgi:hypothetical protein